MILESLCDLARREQLLADPDYEPEPVAGIFSIDDGGKFLGFVSTTSSDSGKRARGKTMQVPRRSPRSGTNPPPDFLVDNSEFVLGFDPNGERNAEDLARRVARFQERVQSAATEAEEPAMIALAAFLGNESERARAAAALSGEDYPSKALLAFEYKGRLIHDSDAARNYFASTRTVQNGNTQCIVCGTNATPVDKHPRVQIPGASSGGIPLVNFNEPAFWSFDLERHQNAPVCGRCADAYTTALKRLLSERYPDPTNPSASLPKQFVRLSADTTAIFWSSEPSPVVSLFADYFDAPTEESMKALFTSPHTGYMPTSPQNRFYCLILSGAQGRAILRGMHTGTVAEVEASLRAWFESIAIEPPQPLPLWRLMQSIVLQGKRENLPPGLMADVFEAIVFKLPFPRTLLARAVARCIAEQSVTRERAALVRGYLTRNESTRSISVALDKENSDAGYRLGRLLAVLERVQSEAQNNPNKTIVDRYYGSASTRPAVVFPTLLALTQHHLAKLEQHRDTYFQKLLGEVVDGIAAPMPSTLRLEEQGQFGLGYYHQRQDFFKKREAADENRGESGKAQASGEEE
ncbi:MAG: type I-C CRISPR-associated protein Cas8c/Csd1 [Acidobacteriaceae bacterium]|nr:type I-C CRISPR-associated protein Cas8c/Csd1 [Acidobacteriaceae bacterium]